MLVLGDGRLGVLVAMALKAEGYDVDCCGTSSRTGASILASTQSARRSLNDRYDVVVDCTGSSRGFSRALELVRPRGTLILKSTAAASGALNLAPVVINEVTVLGSRCGTFAPAIEALASGKIDPRPLILATLPLDDGLHALDEADKSSNLQNPVESFVKHARTAIIAGVDTGGTFTDLVAMIDGELVVHKTLSTPDDPARAVIEGLAQMLGGAKAAMVTYSSTVATNALLEVQGRARRAFHQRAFRGSH